MKNIVNHVGLPALVILGLWVSPATAAQAPTPVQPISVTVPFVMDHNRITVEVEFTRPDGAPRKARAWMDLGSPDLALAESLARDLGLDLSGLKEGATQRSVTLAAPAPPLRLGGLPLDMVGIKLRVHPGKLVRPGVLAEVTLPASALLHHHVILDYGAQSLTVARPGLLQPQGLAIPCRINAETGLVMIAVTMNGETVPLGIDNGSAGTWISDHLTKAWQSRQPNWPWSIGAVSSANFFGFDFETQGTLMRLPELGIGTLVARNVTVLGLDQSLFDWYSKKSAGPVAGFIGANVLKGFRLEIDFPRQMTYWEAVKMTEIDELQTVGLTLRPEADGSYIVAGVATKDGKPTVAGVAAGDKLLRVDALDTTHAAMGKVEDALRGKPGTTHVLAIERAGKPLSVAAKVTRFP